MSVVRAENLQVAALHPGNGVLIKNATIETDSSGLISAINDSLPIPAGIRYHITPLFIDLNIYSGEEIEASGKKLLQRGVNYLLLERRSELFLHNLVTGSDSLLGYYLDTRTDTLSAEALADRWYDTFSCLNYVELTDSLQLPWKVGISPAMISDIMENELPLWVQLDDAAFFKTFDEQVKSFGLPVIYYGLEIDPFSLGIDSISAVLDWELGRKFLQGDNEADTEYHLLNYDLNFAVRIPRLQSFWEFLLFINNTVKTDLNDEEILQMLTVLPGQFLGLEQTVLDVGTPANFIIYTTEPFSLRSRVVALYYLNQVIFRE